MRVRILSSALADLRQGKRFYEEQGEGVGEYFYDSIFSDVDGLKSSAGIHRQLFGHHRLLANRFPFAIYYKIHGGEVVVHRVLDCRQNPSSIRESLD